MLINLESLLKKSIHRLLRDFHTTWSLSLLRKSSWHLWLPSHSSILNSWIIYQSLHLDSSIVSHIHPKRTYRPKLSLRVLSASRFMVFPVASLLSVKRASLSSHCQETISEVNFFQTPASSQLLSSADYTLAYYNILTCRCHSQGHPNPPSYGHWQLHPPRQCLTSSSLSELVLECKTAPEECPLWTDHIPIIATLTMNLADTKKPPNPISSQPTGPHSKKSCLQNLKVLTLNTQ